MNFSRGFKRSKTLTSKVSWHNNFKITLHYHFTSLHIIQFFDGFIPIYKEKREDFITKELFSEFTDVYSMNSFGIYYQSFHFVWWKKKTDGGKRNKFNLKVLFMLWWNLFFMLKIFVNKANSSLLKCKKYQGIYSIYISKIKNLE